jgi:hypothetical protein
MVRWSNKIKSMFQCFISRKNDTCSDKCNDKCMKHETTNCPNCDVLSDLSITPEEALFILRARYLKAHNMEYD